MTPLDFALFDCDNHYYEPIDAFTRHIEPEFRKRTMQWAEIDGKTRLLVGGKVNRFIPNPTFDPIARPGSLDDYFRGRNPEGRDVAQLFGELDPMADHPEYRDRDARLKVMDAQGVEGAIFLPTLGVGMEQALRHDVPALNAAFRAFNRWLDEDWGFAYHERIFAAPMLSLIDERNLVDELDWALEHDARFVVVVPGPVITPSGGRSPADPVYDPFWARLHEAGVTLVVHGGDSYYSTYVSDWGEPAEFEAFKSTPFRSIASWSPVHDFFANLLANRLFARFPNLRLASIETGSDWVFSLFAKMRKSYGQNPKAYPEDPCETFARHVWVSPYYEEDLAAMRDLLGADHLLMGSDWPHAEGLVEPAAYIEDLRGHAFTPEECRLVMRDNGRSLSQRRPA
jgi:predicted TIM-barrel fold metal-dependent hydrolase